MISGAAFALGRGIVMALPHVGSWEWGGYWLALEGMPMTAVVERLEPEQLFEWFVAQREAMGLTAVPLGEGSRARRCCGHSRTGRSPGWSATVTSPATESRSSSSASARRFRAAPRRSRCARARRSCRSSSTRARGIGTLASCTRGSSATRSGSLRDDVARVTQDLARVFEYDIRARPEQWHLYQANWPSDPR